MGVTINPLGPPFDFTGGGGGGATPGGSDTQVQFNDGGVFGGSANFTFVDGDGVDIANHLAVGSIAGIGSSTILAVDDESDVTIIAANLSAIIHPIADGTEFALGTQSTVQSEGTHDLASITAVSGLCFSQTDGSTDSVNGVKAFIDYGGGPVGAGSGVLIDTPVLEGGATAPTAHYGLQIEDQTVAGATTNYAINVNDKFLVSPDGSSRILPAGGSDGAFTGTTIPGTAGAALAFGDLVYLAAADSRWELVDADSVTTCGSVLTGMCVLVAAGDGDPTSILLNGRIRADANFPALTIGAMVYASTTPGDIQVAAPSGTDDIVHVVGYALTADEIYFNPSTTYLTVA